MSTGSFVLVNKVQPIQSDISAYPEEARPFSAASSCSVWLHLSAFTRSRFLLRSHLRHRWDGRFEVIHWHLVLRNAAVGPISITQRFSWVSEPENRNNLQGSPKSEAQPDVPMLVLILQFNSCRSRRSTRPITLLWCHSETKANLKNGKI